MADDIETDTNEMPAPKTRGLGRGLNALFEDEEVYRQPEPNSSEFSVDQDDREADFGAFNIRDDEMNAADTEKNSESEAESLSNRIISLGVEQVVPNADQPRQSYDDEALNDLAESIREHGIIQPVLVRHSDELPVGHYGLVAGERRWRAAQIAQLHSIPAIVIEDNEAKAYEISLIENLQREELNAIEEATGYQYLMVTYAHTQADVAQKVGKSRSHVANMLRLIQLPFQAQIALAEGRITMGHGRAILGAENPEALFKEVLNSNLSVRETEKRAAESTGREIGRKKSGPSKKSKVAKDVNTLALEDDLSQKLGMSVTLDVSKDGSGSMKINYRTLDQLDEIVSRLYTERGNDFYAGGRLND